jgi:hypothetical protein
MRCAMCGEEHDWSAMEPSFERPDAYWAVPEAERPQRTLAGKSDCRIRDEADTERRYFLRVMLPIPIRGEVRNCNWGLWVEVSAPDSRQLGTAGTTVTRPGSPRSAACSLTASADTPRRWDWPALCS